MEELAGGEKVTIDKIVNELKEQGYKIIQKVSGENTVTGIELSNKRNNNGQKCNSKFNIYFKI